MLDIFYPFFTSPPEYLSARVREECPKPASRTLSGPVACPMHWTAQQQRTTKANRLCPSIADFSDNQRRSHEEDSCRNIV